MCLQADGWVCEQIKCVCEQVDGSAGRRMSLRASGLSRLSGKSGGRQIGSQMGGREAE